MPSELLWVSCDVERGESAGDKVVVVVVVVVVLVVAVVVVVAVDRFSSSWCSPLTSQALNLTRFGDE